MWRGKKELGAGGEHRAACKGEASTPVAQSAVLAGSSLDLFLASLVKGHLFCCIVCAGLRLIVGKTAAVGGRCNHTLCFYEGSRPVTQNTVAATTGLDFSLTGFAKGYFCCCKMGSRLGLVVGKAAAVSGRCNHTLCFSEGSRPIAEHAIVAAASL